MAKKIAGRNQKQNARSLSVLTKLVPPFEEIQEGLVRLQFGPDRDAAIVASTYVEHALEIAIQAHFVPLSADEVERLFRGDNGPLSSFSAKIKVGYALGLYGRKTRADLDIVRHVRNAFAHAMADISFDTTEIAQECGKLHIIERPSLASALVLKDTPKHRFVSAVSMLWVSLRVMIVQTTSLEKAVLARDVEKGPLP